MVACTAAILLPSLRLHHDFGSPLAWLWLWLSPLLLLSSQADASSPHVLEVKDMPYHIADRLEGSYTRWTGRWMNGPIYRRNEASLQHNPNVPVFLGPLCGYTYGGLPNIWCFAQCEEEHVLTQPGLLLPCGTPAPDGTDCPAPPPADSSPAAPQGGPRSVYCAILGHARRWHEAGYEAGQVPPPATHWRLNLDKLGWMDASWAAPGSVFAFAEAASAAATLSTLPGERLRVRMDGTLRAPSNAGLCVGAEGGRLDEGVRLLFWHCGQPPHRHERFGFQEGQGRLRLLHAVEQPSLCVCTGSSSGALVLGRCHAEAHSALRPLAIAEAADGSLRTALTAGPADAGAACLSTGGPSRPDVGSLLHLSPCKSQLTAASAAVTTVSAATAANAANAAVAAAAATTAATAAAPEPAPAPPLGLGEFAATMLRAMQAMQEGLEAKLEEKTGALTREVLELRAQVQSWEEGAAEAQSWGEVEAEGEGEDLDLNLNLNDFNTTEAQSQSWGEAEGEGEGGDLDTLCDSENETACHS